MHSNEIEIYEKAFDKRKINISKNCYVTRKRIHLKICIPNLKQFD